MGISQFELEQLIKEGNLLEGGPSPFFKRDNKRTDAAQMLTFAGEKVRWIGKVSTDMFSKRANSRDYDVIGGVSPYRGVLYRGGVVLERPESISLVRGRFRGHDVGDW